MPTSTSEELIAEASQRAGRDLTPDERNTIAGVVLVAEQIAATDPDFAHVWLRTEGVAITRAAMAENQGQCPAADQPLAQAGLLADIAEVWPPGAPSQVGTDIITALNERHGDRYAFNARSFATAARAAGLEVQQVPMRDPKGRPLSRWGITWLSVADALERARPAEPYEVDVTACRIVADFIASLDDDDDTDWYQCGRLAADLIDRLAADGYTITRAVER